jgi:hypothetical protein
VSAPDTSAPLDLVAIEARHREAAMRTGVTTPAWRSAADVPALTAEVHRLRAENADLRAKLDAAHKGAEHDDKALHEAQTATAYAVRAARREGAEAMREACVDALNAMAHAEGIDAERFRLTRGEDSAAEHHHKRAALLEARVTVLGLPLPEVTP